MSDVNLVLQKFFEFRNVLKRSSDGGAIVKVVVDRRAWAFLKHLEGQMKFKYDAPEGLAFGTAEPNKMQIFGIDFEREP